MQNMNIHRIPRLIPEAITPLLGRLRQHELQVRLQLIFDSLASNATPCLLPTSGWSPPFSL